MKFGSANQMVLAHSYQIFGHFPFEYAFENKNLAAHCTAHCKILTGQWPVRILQYKYNFVGSKANIIRVQCDQIHPLYSVHLLATSIKRVDEFGHIWSLPTVDSEK